MMSPGELERYLYGDCVNLALAISARTGWPVMQIFDGDNPDDLEVRHALVRMPDGRLLDAAGPHDNYSGEEPFNRADWDDPDDPADWNTWRAPDVQAAADEVLSEIGWMG